ncbi:laminin subunit gamma-1-like, partial [Pollicipes pollicipes]|uniref:laminin subunit gamma-1-like n=1 Tax=Pollicipes pollicipes TaxID=41117 RepID=UPI001884C956
MARRAAAVLVLCLLTGAEYLDRRHDDVYRRWRGLRYGCRCDPAGSVSTSCDIRTGQCTCHPYVTGDSCDRCQTGSFGLRPGVGCRPCDCDRLGSLRDACDPVTGQ